MDREGDIGFSGRTILVGIIGDSIKVVGVYVAVGGL